jgi:hypothetical protein
MLTIILSVCKDPKVSEFRPGDSLIFKHFWTPIDEMKTLTFFTGGKIFPWFILAGKLYRDLATLDRMRKIKFNATVQCPLQHIFVPNCLKMEYRSYTLTGSTKGSFLDVTELRIPVQLLSLGYKYGIQRKFRKIQLRIEGYNKCGKAILTRTDPGNSGPLLNPLSRW